MRKYRISATSSSEVILIVPQSWPENRYDLIWVFDLKRGSWKFRQFFHARLVTGIAARFQNLTRGWGVLIPALLITALLTDGVRGRGNQRQILFSLRS